MNQGMLPRQDSSDFEKYRLLAQIGRGGMAEAFIAVASGPAGFNKLFVVKRMLPALSADASYRAMFLQEARLAARLNHPNVVQTYEVGEHDGVIFMVMEYLEGQPISRIRRLLTSQERVVSPWTWARVAADTLAGLHYAHELRDFDGAELKVVHRDVSPQNVFVTYEGQVKVLDFGIAKAERGSRKTEAGFFKGKYSYMAPEQFLDGAIDRRVDVFTTGILLWELIAGRALFGGGAGGDAAVLKKLLNEPIPRLRDVRPDIDPRLDEIVACSLEREPEARFSTALEMRAALDALIAVAPERADDLGTVVATAFAESRATISGVVSKALGGRANLAATILDDEFGSVGSIRTFSGTRSIPEAAPETAAPVAATMVASSLPAPPDRRPMYLAAAATLVACAVGITHFATRHPPDEASRTASAATAATPPPPPVNAAPQVPAPTESHEELPPRPAVSSTLPAKVAPVAPVAAPVWRPSVAAAPPPPATKLPPPAALPAASPPAPTPAAVASPSPLPAEGPSPPARPPEGRRFRTTF